MTPWPWIAVSAYAATLVWALIGDLVGDRAVIATLQDWQTLIAGLATVAALVYAGRQLQRDRLRDRLSFVQHHSPEWDALSALEVDLEMFQARLSPVIGALHRKRSGYGAIGLDADRWLRLNGMCSVTIDQPLREYMAAASWFDDHVSQVNRVADAELSESEKDVTGAILALLSDRRNALLTAIWRQKELISSRAPP